MPLTRSSLPEPSAEQRAHSERLRAFIVADIARKWRLDSVRSLHAAGALCAGTRLLQRGLHQARRCGNRWGLRHGPRDLATVRAGARGPGRAGLRAHAGADRRVRCRLGSARRRPDRRAARARRAVRALRHRRSVARSPPEAAAAACRMRRSNGSTLRPQGSKASCSPTRCSTSCRYDCSSGAMARSSSEASGCRTTPSFSSNGRHRPICRPLSPRSNTKLGPLPEGYGSEIGFEARAWMASVGDWLQAGCAPRDRLRLSSPRVLPPAAADGHDHVPLPAPCARGSVLVAGPQRPHGPRRLQCDGRGGARGRARYPGLHVAGALPAQLRADRAAEPNTTSRRAAPPRSDCCPRPKWANCSRCSPSGEASAFR